MEHVVFFPAPDGAPAFRRVPSLEEAVRLVEHLRNVEGLTTVSVHALTEVPLAFRAYYRVEVPADVVVPLQQVADALPVHEPIGLEPEAVAPEAYAPVVFAEAEAEDEAPVEAVAEEAPEAAEPEVAEEPVLVASNGHPVPAPASLGFFA